MIFFKIFRDRIYFSKYSLSIILNNVLQQLILKNII